jgi:flagellar biogenesis protein FliO
MNAVVTLVKILAVFALLGITLFYLRKYDAGRGRTAMRGERPVALLSQTRLTKTSSVALVRIGDAAYAVGVTEKEICLLVPQALSLDMLDPRPETRPTPAPAAVPAVTPVPAVADRIPAQATAGTQRTPMPAPRPRTLPSPAPSPSPSRRPSPRPVDGSTGAAARTPRTMP